MQSSKKKLIVAITGASGAVYGVRILRHLQTLPDWESHLVLSQSGALTASQELDLTRAEIESMAGVVHSVKNIGATIASGSFPNAGMIVAPCSMKTLAAIALGLADNLVARAADVALKERRRVALMTRETPLNLAHLRNMTAATEMGAIICPPVPAFYARPASIDDMVDHTVGRVLDLFDIPHDKLTRRWDGIRPAGADSY
ncbi:UbiX family flavin prenyltransferase [Parapusillimonas granuli]|uniref:Flavin prenyltransferase UbiX n=1 Tax=Parapusillimonas granuli TaxID=380911 RepID=A0A853FZC8_9BURK|nr:UbiX family flavin prenyltransferase [Parapusillimonas granuli]MBB5215129.1 polyprenyl P-hydroxybenzoate/phenylacrylic acid decarboxylase-like protein [Parapusillimonas granuli]MEB2401436.1 UbiX family flavin prenyltransferase [Alcaligenaceae bacterium]NYT49447.1 UbiX family flavin prenyltransferase [Parapusillimonas granuli]